MTRITLAAAALVLGLVAAGPLAAQGNPSALYDRAKRAIASGNVVPERDLAPLIGVLRAPASTEDLHSAIDEGLVNTVAILVAAGADLKRKDDNGNTILTSAAQMCGPKIVGKLVAAGAEVNVANRSGMTPLSMALLMHRPDAAEVLVASGARLNASQVQMLGAAVTDPREKAILKRAAGK